MGGGFVAARTWRRSGEGADDVDKQQKDNGEERAEAIGSPRVIIAPRKADKAGDSEIGQNGNGPDEMNKQLHQRSLAARGRAWEAS